MSTRPSTPPTAPDALSATPPAPLAWIEVAPGVWRLRLGEPEAHTPISLNPNPIGTTGFECLPGVDTAPLKVSDIRFSTRPRGVTVELPLGEGEQIFGFGLQLKSLNQTAKKRTIRVNSDPVMDTGDSHAPVPFYASTGGYGILVDTLRYALVNTGSHVKVGRGKPAQAGSPPSGNLADLYRARELDERFVVVDIPVAQGVDIYLFAGPDLCGAVQRYNLFSGGGCLPPLWGLGVWYRGYTGNDAAATLKLAEGLRASEMPVTVFGLEPGWQTNSYSCDYRWSEARFPDPDGLIERMHDMGFRLNLWEHVFVHPNAELYDAMKPLSGDYEVWGGLVPDLSLPAAAEGFATHHGRELIDRGISGFKLDECDNSDCINYAWSFPEATQFPSGMDGEQMHSALGILYQRVIDGIFRSRNRRTYSEVRASHALAAPYPFVLYSDLYDHRDFVRGVSTSGFGGVLWSPEVRDSATPEELIRRIQSVAMSPQALVNAWYIHHPPWQQVQTAKNNAGEFMENAAEITAICRDIFRLRQTLIPYLYAAFARYRFEGLPPFRAVVMDYPDDPQTYKLDLQYMMGDDIMVAPVFAGMTTREVYLPAGTWYDFHTRKSLEGGKKHVIPVDLLTIPMFVKAGAILPLAAAVDLLTDDVVFDITAVVFGNSARTVTLFEDDGTSYDYERGDCARVRLSWHDGAGQVERHGSYSQPRHRIVAWDVVPSV